MPVLFYYQEPARKGSRMKPNLAAQMDPVYLETLYQQWQEDTASVDESWQLFFQGFDLASCPRSCVAAAQAADQSRVASLIYNYRDQGHRLADINPLSTPPPSIADLELSAFGFEPSDLDRVFDTGHLSSSGRATLREILQILRDAYCGHLAVEYLHIQDVTVRRWLQEQIEIPGKRPRFDHEGKLAILKGLVDAELFESFVQGHYLGQKRFSVEGAETLIPMLRGLTELAPALEVEEIVLAMAHRGRLNVLANLLQKSYASIFSEFEDNFLPGSVSGDGDVKYHKGYGSVLTNRAGQRIKLSLSANPSHLEAVGPVALGRARAKQNQRQYVAGGGKVLPVLIHGDAAFAGQGIVAETLNLSRLEGYRVGGTLHIVLNNQIGFTTLPGQSRSSRYVTDVAKMVGAPVFHVNGEFPQAAVHATNLALRFRQIFHRDVVVDLLCYRRHGHSEVDEPAFTQPVLYQEIQKRSPVRQLYVQQLVAAGDLSQDEADEISEQAKRRLTQAHEQAKNGQPEVAETPFGGKWEGLDQDFSFAPVVTAVSQAVLTEVAQALARVPEDFELHRKIAKSIPVRAQAVEQGESADWSMAEALAFGSLLLEEIPVRLSGQDSERGTFSQRHAVWRDMKSATVHVPLNHIRESQARIRVFNSPLSEASVLGFEYGYSLAEPHMLLLWEAQFGDFANGAQVIIDQFLVAAQSKWQRASGLVLLLPHGHEGQGPEHSNAYLERYLIAGAEDNIQVCNPSTPAQYFHVLRRQMKRPFRRPLVLMTPKSLLRHKQVVSPMADFSQGSFQEILDDPKGSDGRGRLVLCSGKIYYDLLAAREAAKIEGVALVRIEQLYPFHQDLARERLQKYQAADSIVWAQEEPENRGAYRHLRPELQSLFPDQAVHYVGRKASASPAVGSLRKHRQEQERIVSEALGRQGGI